MARLTLNIQNCEFTAEELATLLGLVTGRMLVLDQTERTVWQQRAEVETERLRKGLRFRDRILVPVEEIVRHKGGSALEKLRQAV
jgi:hypothetical protein